MFFLEKLSNFFGKFMAFIVLAIAALALFIPSNCSWIKTSWVNYLLMIVMFGMGLTLKLEDFKVVFTRPKDIIIGCISQFTIMPLLAPLLTPLITYLLLKTTVEVNILAMFLSIVKVLPMISVIAICMIVAAVVSANASKILTTGAIVFVVVILHNVLGYACDFVLGKLLKLDIPKTKALSVEIGMQNSGLATSLANIYNHLGNKDDQEI